MDCRIRVAPFMIQSVDMMGSPIIVRVMLTWPERELRAEGTVHANRAVVHGT